MSFYMARDQWGNTLHDIGPRPRKALMAHSGRRSARPIFVDTKDGRTVRIGWYCGGHWWTVYRVERVEKERRR